MSTGIAPETLEAFRTLVARSLGLRCEDAQLDRLADVLRLRLHATGVRAFPSYAAGVDAEEVRVLAGLLTVGESSFFRSVDNFTALTELALPERMRARLAAGTPRLRILSAGCSSGEEVYTLAILLRERLPELAAWDVRIVGIDVNPQALARARRGRYSAWSLRETPEAMRTKYFRAAGCDHQIDPALSSWVEIDEKNLVTEDPIFWQPDSFDAIFCRNVTMYFTPEAAAGVVERLHRSLAAGGYLFLGYAETLRGVSKDFHLRHTHQTFYYQKRGPGEPHAEPHAAEPATASWYDEVRRSAQRIESLVGPLAAPGVDWPRPAPIVPELALALDLLRRERYAEATALVRTLPPDPVGDPDTRLVLAALLTNGGGFEEAEAICRRILELDELCGGAHYLMALAREHQGDSAGAVEHDEAAIYLDPTFAMPHLHLGLLAKRRCDRTVAHSSLSQALALFAREDAARILLFGGGFTREMLIEFCRSQLRVKEDP